jgi:hypothetical protein
MLVGVHEFFLLLFSCWELLLESFCTGNPKSDFISELEHFRFWVRSKLFSINVQIDLNFKVIKNICKEQMTNNFRFFSNQRKEKF